MIKGSVKNLALFCCAAFDLDLSQHTLPSRFSPAAHGVEIPVGDFLQEVGARLFRADERNADLHLHGLPGRSVEGGVSADFSFVGSRHRSRFNTIISPRTEGCERTVKLGGKVDGVRRLIPAADEIAAPLDAIRRDHAYPTINRMRVLDGILSGLWLHYGTGLDQNMRKLRGRIVVTVHRYEPSRGEFRFYVRARKTNGVVAWVSRSFRL